MKVLLVGSGGREHALAWKLAQSPRLSKLYVAPGNAGIAGLAECLPLAAEDVEGLVGFAKTNAIDFVIVGPEAPLTLGLADRLIESRIKVFGPRAGAAQLEGSKAFMKDLAAKAGIPTAWYGRFTDAETAKAFIREKGAPIVVKASGLAAGKGVILCPSLEEALDAVDLMMVKREFGAAGDEIVIEEFLMGEEASFFALCDGHRAVPFAAAQDHKAVGDGDTGPNTGGMGAYSPAPVVTPALEAEIMERIVSPAVKGMAEQGCPFTGVLFAGLMIGKDGPKLIEFNVRFGDPECQVLMSRLEGDLLEILLAAAEGRLDQAKISWKPDTALVVVMAAQGYPGSYKKGTVIEGLQEAGTVEGVTVFHAGTKALDGRILANGGRVLGVTATGATVKQAQTRAYQAVGRLNWPEGFCRRDIGWRAVAREEKA
ncbi:MAG: phosphoribosylamine--glycine ligase [Alphaproteobacteria bacterium]|nr:phosphoribosylamine--glycine ligase [Alphaproteobacteria bacterium]